MMVTSRPVPFKGTEEEKIKNYLTHNFDPQYDRCIFCDCRPWGETRYYPCGAEVPREVIHG